MTMKELSRCTAEQLKAIKANMYHAGNFQALARIDEVEKYYHKTVRVVKGRKVPKGTEGECFWMGQFDNSKYGDPWGIYTTVRIGIKDTNGNVYWTALDNVELI